MSTLGIVAIVVGTYFTVGAISVCVRAWFLGAHRVQHGGERVSGCDHPGCDSTVSELLWLTLMFWPLFVPVQLMMILVRKIMRAPYLRSLPPQGHVSEESLRREVVDAVMALGSMKHFTTGSNPDDKWMRLHKAMEALKLWTEK